MELLLKLALDEDARRPDEDRDGCWTMYGFDTDSVIDVRREDKPLTIGLRKKLKVGLAFLLTKGNEDWHIDENLSDAMNIDEADGLIVWEEPPGNIGAKRLEDRQKDAQCQLDEYNAWANGYVYGFQLYAARDGSVKAEHVDSCWGFYDTDYMLREIEDYVRSHYRPDKEPTFVTASIEEVIYGERVLARRMSKKKRGRKKKEPAVESDKRTPCKGIVIEEDGTCILVKHPEEFGGLPVILYQ